MTCKIINSRTRPINIDERKCSRCGKIKPLTLFYDSKGNELKTCESCRKYQSERPFKSHSKRSSGYNQRRKQTRKQSDSYSKVMLKQRGVNNPTSEQIEVNKLNLNLKRKVNELRRKIDA